MKGKFERGCFHIRYNNDDEIIWSLLARYSVVMEFEECWATANQLRNWRRLKKTLAQIWRFRETNRFSTMVRRKLRKINDTPLKSRVETGDIYVSPLYRSKDINYTFYPSPFLFHSPPRFRKFFSLGYYRKKL